MGNVGSNRHSQAIDEVRPEALPKHPTIRRLLPLISYNYARELAANKQYEDAIEIAELGRQSCVTYGHYQFLPGVLAIMASCYHFLEKDEESEALYHQTYYLYQAIDNPGDGAQIKEEAKST